MKKFLKSSLSLLLVAVMMLSLASCGATKKAETTVKNMLDSFKAGNLEEMEKYVVGEVSTDSAETEKFTEYMASVFDKLEYEIVLSEQVDDSTVNVTAKITMIDMKPVLTDFFMEALKFAFANALADPQPTQEEINKKTEEMFVTAVTKPDLATVTNEVVIRVVNSEGEWKVEADDALTDAMFGGLVKAAEEITSSFAQ